MNELTRIETVVFLQQVNLFSHCTANQILRISAIVHQQRFARNATIYAASESADQLYCIVGGTVQLRGPGSDTHNATSLQTFGVAEILGGRRRAADAVAMEETHVITIDAHDFFGLLSDNIEIVKALFRRLLHNPEASDFR